MSQFLIGQTMNMLNNETYMNLYNSTLRYENNIDNKNIIDIGFKKSLYKEKIITDFFIRNLLNIKYYYHQ